MIGPPPPNRPTVEPLPTRPASPADSRPSVWPPHAMLDGFAVLVLLALAVIGLWPIFDGTQWIVIAGLGAAFGLAWVLLLLRFRLGMDLVFATLLIPYLLTAGGLVLRKGAWGFLPDQDTLGEVFVGTAMTWKRIAETAPPVEATGEVLLAPYALTFLLGGAATVMALRSRRPVLPLIPLLGVLLMVQLLGIYTQRGDVWSALGFAGAAVAWVAHRGNRADKKAPGRTPAAAGFSARQLLAGAVVIALAVGMVLPLARQRDGERWLLREAVKPFDSESRTTPLSSFRRFRPGPLESLATQEIFVVEGVPEGTQVRLAVLDSYDGEQWRAARDRGSHDDLDRFLRVPRAMHNPGIGKADTATFTMSMPWEMDWLPVVGRVQEFHFFADGKDRQESLRYNLSTGAALLPGGLPEDETYAVTTLVSQPVLRPGMSPWPQRDEELWRAAAFLDDVVIAWSHATETPMEALFKMAATLRKRGRYSDGAEGWERQFEAGHGKRRLTDEFVYGDMQVGNDEQYAATMALLANRLGIPARVVVGAVVGEDKEVLGKQVSAWVEVRIANGTWRTLPTSTFMSRRPPEPDEEPLQKIRPPVSPNLPQPPSTPEDQAEQDPEDPLPPEELSQDPEQEEESGGTSWRRWAWALVLLPVVPPAAKVVRRRRRRRARLVSRRFVGGWDEVLDLSRDLGRGVGATTRGRQAIMIGVPPALARKADIATFAEETPDRAAGDAYWSDVRVQLKDLRRRAPFWRRVVAVVNPASLLPRRR